MGVALPFSIATAGPRSVAFRDDGPRLLAGLLLIVLGIFLRSTHSPQTNFTFEDTLTQIGLGYGFLFLLGFRPARDQWIALAAILAGYWAAFALYPLPAGRLRLCQGGRLGRLARARTDGLCRALEQEQQSAWAFDTWFLNLFPRQKPFVSNAGGYSTLSFIPTLGTMILGLIAGGVLRSERTPWGKVGWLDRRGGDAGLGLAAGLAGRLSGGQAHLDAQLDLVQRRLVLPAARGVLCGHRYPGGAPGRFRWWSLA